MAMLFLFDFFFFLFFLYFFLTPDSSFKLIYFLMFRDSNKCQIQ